MSLQDNELIEMLTEIVKSLRMTIESQNDIIKTLTDQLVKEHLT